MTHNHSERVAVRIGLISDTHVRDDLVGMPSEILQAFEKYEVELILHLGDIESPRVLDVLEKIAPVFAVRDSTELPSTDPRLAHTRRVIQVADKRIGMVHDIGWPGPRIIADKDLKFPIEPFPEVLEQKFGQVVDVVAFGHTHEELIAMHQGVLFVNPGSPTYPGTRHRLGALGTIAILDIQVNGQVTAEIVDLAGLSSI